MNLTDMKTNDQVFPRYAKYRKFRKEHPLIGAQHALRYAKAWELSKDLQERWGNDDNGIYKRTMEKGFVATLEVREESMYPIDYDNMGHYVDVDRHQQFDMEWQGNWPQPVESFPLNLPYTVFAAAAFTQSYGSDFYYWVPDGVEDQYESFPQGRTEQVCCARYDNAVG